MGLRKQHTQVYQHFPNGFQVIERAVIKSKNWELLVRIYKANVGALREWALQTETQCLFIVIPNVFCSK